MGTWALWQANDRRESLSGVAVLPRPATAALAHVGRKRLNISTPAEDRQDKAIPARADSARDCLEGTEPLDDPLPEAGCARQTNEGGLHRDRP